VLETMEADKDRGDYHDPDVGKILFSDVAYRWLSSRVVDPSSLVRYETAYRLHVIPAFRAPPGPRHQAVGNPGVDQRTQRTLRTSTVITSFLVVQGILDLGVADDVIRKNPAKSPVIRAPVQTAPEIQIWEDRIVICIIGAHPDLLRDLPELAASCGPREGELFGLAQEDFDFDEKTVRFRRQIKKLGDGYVFALPKNDRERVVPLSDWAIQVAKWHIEKYPPQPYTLPREKPDGKPHTCRILFRWPTDGQHVKARNYSETIWKPALVRAGVIPPPTRDRRGRSRYTITRKEGIHQLRHYFASVMPAGGVSITELAEYLGHSDPAFTLRVYTHMLPSSHDRARAVVNDHFTALTATEQ
jgi:integrase